MRKYDTAGNEQWARQFGTDENDWATGIAANDSGVYVAGATYGAFPGYTSTSTQDLFVRKYDEAGNELWTRQFGTVSNDWAAGVAAVDSGLYLTGHTWGVLPSQSNAGSIDAFVLKYDPAGNERWTRQFGTTWDDSAKGVAVDAAGVYLTGETNGAFPGHASAGRPDAFVGRFSENTSTCRGWAVTRACGSPTRPSTRRSTSKDGALSNVNWSPVCEPAGRCGSLEHEPASGERSSSPLRS